MYFLWYTTARAAHDDTILVMAIHHFLKTVQSLTAEKPLTDGHEYQCSYQHYDGLYEVCPDHRSKSTLNQQDLWVL